MIYASDLDRTLIFSEHFLVSKSILNKENLILIDESKVNSYIDKDVAIHINYITSDIIKGIRFIPVTTRSVEEYKRIQFNRLNIDIDYAITSNGGTILFKNKPLKEWEEYISKQIELDELHIIKEELNKLNCIDYDTKIIDNRYVFSKCKKGLEGKDCEAAIDTVVKKISQQYNIFSHKTKVYVIPKSVGKDIALTWLKLYIKEDKVIASGDSAFDLPMLSIADFSIIPEHSSIEKEKLKYIEYIEVNGDVRSPLKTMKIIEKSVGVI